MSEITTMPSITSLYAGVLGLIWIVIAVQAGRLRGGPDGVLIGDGGKIELISAMRRHANFVESGSDRADPSRPPRDEPRLFNRHPRPRDRHRGRPSLSCLWVSIRQIEDHFSIDRRSRHDPRDRRCLHLGDRDLLLNP
jgi:hypothetical protein